MEWFIVESAEGVKIMTGFSWLIQQKQDSALFPKFLNFAGAI